MADERQKRNIYQRIAAVMEQVKYLSKDDKVEFKATKYKAISEEKVTTAVRAAMLQNGLIVYPCEMEHTRQEYLTTVNIKYKMVNIDDPTEFIIIASAGTGVDTQDKGVGKAMTYAFKYMALRTFAIPTGEDPDKVSSDQLDEELKKATTEEINSFIAAYRAKGISDDQMKEMLKGKSLKNIKSIDLKKCYRLLEG